MKLFLRGFLLVGGGVLGYKVGALVLSIVLALLLHASGQAVNSLFSDMVRLIAYAV